MTPKEKAKELVDKMEKDFQYFASREVAKQHALIAVDEILNLNHPCAIVYSEISENVMTDYTQEYYWQQVKQEIQNL